MDQHGWVAGCLSYYQENDLIPEPGWEQAHYPVPKCLGGTETIWLTHDHHQIQGLLQSEEYGCACFHNGEVKKYLRDYPERGDLWDLYWKWSGENGRENGGKAGKENGRKTGRNNASKMNDHPNTLGARRGNAEKTNNQRWRCLVTRFVTNPGNLTQYQKARGIDTSLRERVG